MRVLLRSDPQFVVHHVGDPRESHQHFLQCNIHGVWYRGALQGVPASGNPNSVPEPAAAANPPRARDEPQWRPAHGSCGPRWVKDWVADRLARWRSTHQPSDQVLCPCHAVSLQMRRGCLSAPSASGLWSCTLMRGCHEDSLGGEEMEHHPTQGDARVMQNSNHGPRS